MQEITYHVWTQLFQVLAVAALPAGGSLLNQVGKSTDCEKSMSDIYNARLTKELEVLFLKAIDENHAIIHKICYFWCHNRADGEDLYQEIVYQLWKAYPSFKGDSTLSTWIHKVALRAAILPFRRKKEVKIEYLEAPPERSQIESSDGLDDQLVGALAQLEPKDRAIVVLMAEGYDNKEIGTILGMYQPLLRMRQTRIHRAIKNL